MKARRSSESAIATEALMNNAGEARCDGAVMVLSIWL